MLQRGEQVPHFVVHGVNGARVAYSDIWQRRNLLLISVADAVDANQIAAHTPELTAHDTAIVVTTDPIAGIPRPGVLIADRWGEIQCVAEGEMGRTAPGIAEITAWLEYVQSRCPECEGEAR